MILALMIKMIACSAILYGYYWLFLRNKRFHHYNRFYLLAATALSIIIPFIKIPVFLEPGTATSQIVHKSIDIISVDYWENEIAENPATNNINSWLTLQNGLILLYGAGVLCLAYILLRSLFYIYRLSKKYHYEYVNSLKLYNTTEPGTPFSFFQSIYWNSSLDVNSSEGQQIFRHELFHVKQKHSADIVFLECIGVLLWMNPFFHLIKKEIKAIHEFLADQHAIANNDRFGYAELLVLQSIHAKRSPISNYFFQNHIKRRIAMITQFRNKNYSYWTRLMALPLSVLLFCAAALYAQSPKQTETVTKSASSATVSFSEIKEINEEKQIIEESNKHVRKHLPRSITILVDAGHGGADAGARSADKMFAEKDLALAIARQIKQHAPTYNIEVVMTRDNDDYPSLKTRREMAEAANADMSVSIHLGAAEAAEKVNNEKGGVELFITNKNERTMESSRLIAASMLQTLGNVYKTQSAILQHQKMSIRMLDSVYCPAVLMNCGYITNEKDVAFISQPKNQEKIAKSILEGIVNYQSGERIADTVPVKKQAKDGMTDSQKLEMEKKAQLLAQKHEQLQLEQQKMQEKFRVQQQKLELTERKMAEMQNAKMQDLEKRQLQQQQHLELTSRKMEEIQNAKMKNHENIQLQQQQHLEMTQAKKCRKFKMKKCKIWKIFNINNSNCN